MVRRTRRDFVRQTGSALSLLAGGALTAVPAAGETFAATETGVADADGDWPTFHGSPARTGFTSHAGPVDEPTARRFTQLLPERSRAPRVVDGVVYLTGVSTVVAFDPEREQTLWETDVTLSEDATITVDDGTVYHMGGEYTRRECELIPPMLTAIDADDGTVLWERVIDAGRPVGPAVVDGTAYVVAEGSLLAFDADGTQRWVADTLEYTGQLPAVCDGVLVTSASGSVVALDASDGSEKWVRGVEYVHNLAIADGTVYAETAYGLVALSLADGTIRWQATSGMDSISRAPIVAHDRIYAATKDGNVVAFSTADGSEVWRCDSITGGGLCVDPETVYVSQQWYPDTPPTVYAIDASDGSLRWRHSIQDMHPEETPVLADGTLFFGGDSLTALSANHP